MLHETTTEAITIVKASAQRLFPDQSLEQVLAELLLERARKNLIHYRAMASRFEEKCQQAFATLRYRTSGSESPILAATECSPLCRDRRAPRGPARVLLQVAARHPEAVWDVVRPLSQGE
jgi:hypothetical protein